MSSSGNRYRSNRGRNVPVTRRNIPQKTNLYVKNFDNKMNESELCKLFATYGTITSCKIPGHQSNQTTRYGFVNFLTSSMAEDAIDNLNDYLLENGKKLYVGYFQSSEDRREGLQQTYYKTCEDRNLYISNLDDTITDEKLKSAFSKYGTITSAKIMVTDRQSKGYGFVCFSTSDEASEAIDDMNGQTLGSKPIYVALSKDRKEVFQNQQLSEKTINAQRFHPNTRSRNVADYSGIPLTSSNRQIPSTIQLSNRLPRRLYIPSTDQQSQLNSSLNNEYASLNLSALNIEQPVEHNANTSSNDDDDEQN